MAQGVDTGPTLLSRPLQIEETDTAGILHDRLSHLGAEVLIETFLIWELRF